MRKAAGVALLRCGYRIVRTGVPTDVDDAAFAASFRRCQPFTMTSAERMYALWQAVEHVERHGVAGDIVECGVWRGGSSMLAALASLEFGATARRLWLLDTFEGMSMPGTNDVYKNGTPVATGWNPTDNPLLCYASLEDVKANMASTGYPHDLVSYVRGRVEDSLADVPIDRISILRLDTDWYESTRYELEVLWDRLSPHGVLIIDDYGDWDGARRAVDEFFAGRADAPMLTRIDGTGRIAVRAS